MPIRSLTFSPDSQLLITASDDNHIKMYDVYHSLENFSYTENKFWLGSLYFAQEHSMFGNH